MSAIKKYINEVGVGVVFLILLGLLIHPLYTWMPGKATMMFVLTLFVVWVIFAMFVWREQTGDEREELHRNLVSRIAFLAGSGTLVLGIISQSITHTLDPWLVVVLSVMIIAKIGGHIYLRARC